MDFFVDIDERMENFKKDIQTLNNQEVIEKYYQHNAPACLSHDTYFELRKLIQNHFGIAQFTDIFMVGSGQLGFTIKPQERYRKFGDQSDIDLAIISDELFENFWRAVYIYKNEGSYWPKENDFKDYLFKGWIRPDYLPRSEAFRETEDWWEFFRQLTSSDRFGPYKIAGGLYFSRFFFESYQSLNIEACRRELIEV
ncbi:hypothetical protein SPSYN_01103 [Sporotomaculum syntrophicum]|uniref:Uncharacterized protein n=1 Tax=Sporotomaculum syntrophicum TaxID=182264 RepID=A0A9D2WQX5_9FIRM|nr:hypothetical protein [Sporotomaculum syntrophicum]KAF1084967.1 hypothetical protein SPSYN_01103 [Sporotomaculum syntrophicum]